MNKQVLNIEQMQHLKALGIDTSKGSVVRIFLDKYLYEIDWEDLEKTDERCSSENDSAEYMYYDEDYECWSGVSEQILDAEDGDYDHSHRDTCACFTLQDVLNILPSDITIKEQHQTYYLSLDKYECEYFVHDKSKNDLDILKTTNGGSLKAAFKMLCWAKENGYLDLNNK